MPKRVKETAQLDLLPRSPQTDNRGMTPGNER
jgi:hypothetical protein